MSKDRVSEIDCDFAHTGRGRVIEYVNEKYGSGNVSRVVTFGTLQGKMVIKDVARAMGYEVSFGANLAKMIPNKPGAKIEDAFNENPEFVTAYENNADIKRVIDIARKLEGLTRHKSVHPCAVDISAISISDLIPTTTAEDKETGEMMRVTQIQGAGCEELGILKMDFLGLKNMTVIQDVLNGAVKEFGLENVLKDAGIEGSDLDYRKISLKDRATYKMLSEGLTSGVFQLESEGMTKVVKDMLYDIDDISDENLEELFERLIAAVALYRPGPLQYIPDYVNGMREPESVQYDCPEEEEILKNTYGQIVYQEQVMQLVQKLAGYSLARADLVRKAMGPFERTVARSYRNI